MSLSVKFTLLVYLSSEAVTLEQCTQLYNELGLAEADMAVVMRYQFGFQFSTSRALRRRDYIIFVTLLVDEIIFVTLLVDDITFVTLLVGEIIFVTLLVDVILFVALLKE